MKAIKEMFKRLFIPGYTDKQVRAIDNDTENVIESVNKTTKRFNSVLEENGFTMQIYVAAGGKHSSKGSS